MNPFREQGDVPSVPYNKTEVELARIREQEETKRQIGVAREKTKQTARNTEGHWIIRGLIIVAVVLVSLFGYEAYSAHLRAAHPESVNCIESAEVISVNDSVRTCSAGGWYESAPGPTPGTLSIRCRCGARPQSSTSAPVGSVGVGNNGGDLTVKVGAP